MTLPLGVTQPAGGDIQSLVWEVVLTFFLMVVIVAVAIDTRAVGQLIEAPLFGHPTSVVVTYPPSGF